MVAYKPDEKMSNITLDQLRVGIPLQCEILFDEDEFHGEILLSRKDTDDDPIVSIAITKLSDEVMATIQNELCAWLDREGFEQYAFVLGNASQDGSFIVKLDPDVPQV